MINSEQIQHFSSAYLHEEWDIDHPTIQDAFRQYIKDSPSEDIKQFKEDVQSLLNRLQDEAGIYRELLENGWQLEFEDGLLRSTLEELLKIK